MICTLLLFLEDCTKLVAHPLREHLIDGMGWEYPEHLPASHYCIDYKHRNGQEMAGVALDCSLI